MSKPSVAKRIVLATVLCRSLGASLVPAVEVPTPVLKIDASEVTAQVSPMLYGMMTEELNSCYDGGLYGELIRNRIFKETFVSHQYQDKESLPEWRNDGLMFWNVVAAGGGTALMEQDTSQPMNEALTKSLKLTVTNADGRVGISNEGFWGIPVRPNTQYKARIHVKGGDGFTGPLTLAIVSNDGETVYAQTHIQGITDSYARYNATLTTGNVEPTADAHFHIWAGDTGTVWFSLVSLFPPTYKNRPNGLRPDIMQLLIDMKPAFLRFPGGAYLEGQTIDTRFAWKRTIGDISERPSHKCDAWGCWSSDGMGLLEFLTWCEDMDAEPVVGVYSGYSFQERVGPGEELEPFVQDALDEIEYITGDTSTTWGAHRARDGHPEPFKLTYVEIGNEENLGMRGGGSEYDARFTQFYDAIKARYPDIKIIAATPYNTSIIQGRIPDVYDDHFYWHSLAQARLDTNRYDDYDRNGPKVFVGEWATRVGDPTPNMGAALSDAAWMTGTERNSDIVIMQSYAPLFVNVNPGAMLWVTDLIGFNTLTCYASPAYYAQQMFCTNLGNTVVATTLENVPSQQMERPRRGRRGGGEAEQPTPAMVDVPSLFANVTRDSASGMIYVKVVNAAGTPQPVQVQISGVDRIAATGQMVEMTGESYEDTNSITDPKNIVPVTKSVDGLSTDFTRTFPPYSITVLKLP